MLLSFSISPLSFSLSPSLSLFSTFFLFSSLLAPSLHPLRYTYANTSIRVYVSFSLSLSLSLSLRAFFLSFLPSPPSPSLLSPLSLSLGRSVFRARSSIYDETHQRIHQIKNAIIKKRRRLFVEKQGWRSDPPGPFFLPPSPLTPSAGSLPCHGPCLLPSTSQFPRTYVVHNRRRSSVYQSLRGCVTRFPSPFSSATFASTYVRTYVPRTSGFLPRKKMLSIPRPLRRDRHHPPPPLHALNYKTLRNMAPSAHSAPRPTPCKPSVKTMTGWYEKRAVRHGCSRCAAGVVAPAPSAALLRSRFAAFVSFRFVSFRSVSFRFVSFRLVFAGEDPLERVPRARVLASPPL